MSFVSQHRIGFVISYENKNIEKIWVYEGHLICIQSKRLLASQEELCSLELLR
jgi:hypothetical protein